MIIDLHTHTNQSDGELSPVDLLNRAKKYNVSVISITDHDTLAAYDQDIATYSEKIGIDLVPGVEISTMDERGKKWHILGHFIDPFDSGLREWLELLRQTRQSYSKQAIVKLKSVGWKLDEAKLLQLEVISKAHIADAVLDCAENKSFLNSEFSSRTPSRGEFIENVMNKGRPAYVPRLKSPTPLEAINTIRRAGGVASIAHPIAGVYEQNMTFKEIADAVTEFAPDGIEAYYYYFSKSRGDQKLEMIHDFTQLAKKLDIVPIGGSDFHGTSKKIGNFVEIGMVGEECTMDEEWLKLLKSRQIF